MNIAINIDADRVYVNDNLTYLIQMYDSFASKGIANVLDHIASRVKQFQLSKYNEQGFKNLREQYNQTKEPLDLFVLTAFSFNHQIRFNNSHEYNNPFGKNRSSYNKNMEQNLIRFLKKLESTNYIFSSKCFEKFDFDLLSKDDFVYCDPPYLITTGCYNDGKRGFKGWNEQQETLLLQTLDELNAKNIRFALSNVLAHKGQENLLLKQWLDNNDYLVNHINSDYSNCNYQSINNKGSVEVLITNYQIPQQNQILTLFNHNEIYR
jgi:DNA adenine methylase